MSTDDDFEARLRTRLADLADEEGDWADPLPAARRPATTGGPGGAPSDGRTTDDVGDLPDPTPWASARRRWLPGLAVAATVVALLVGGGFGVRALVAGGDLGSASSDSGGAAAAAGRSNGPQAPDAGSVGGSSSVCAAPLSTPCGLPNGSEASAGNGSAVGGNDTAGCAESGPATSTGPLATVASIRPSGIVGPKTTAGGTAAIPYQLTFAETGGTADVRAARAERVSEGRLCSSSGTALPGAVQAVPVGPGAGVNGSATFAAFDSSGRPLPGGRYQVVVVIPYSVGGSGMSQLVSAPVTVTVS